MMLYDYCVTFIIMGFFIQERSSTIEHSIQGLLTKEESLQYNLYTDLLASERHFCLRVILAYVDVLCVADRCVVERIHASME